MHTSRTLPVMEDLTGIHYPGDPVYNQTAGFAAWTDSYWDAQAPEKAQQWISQIHTLVPSSGKRSIVTAGGLHETLPRITSQGNVYFLSEASASAPLPETGVLEQRLVNEFFISPQLWYVPATSEGFATQLTHMRHGITGYEISPDEKKLFFCSWKYERDHMAELTAELTACEREHLLQSVRYEPVIYDTPGYKSDAELGYQSKRSQTLWMLSLEDGALTCLLDHTVSFYEPFWRPDSQAILYQTYTQEGLLAFYELAFPETWAATAASPAAMPYAPILFASVRNTSPCFEHKGAPLFTTDGAQIIFAGTQPDADYADPRGLYAIPASGGQAITATALISLTETMDGIFPQCFPMGSHTEAGREFLVLPDQYAYYVSASRGSVQLNRVPLIPDKAGAAMTAHAPVQLTSGSITLSDLSLCDDHTLLCLYCTPCTLPELALIDIPTGSITPLTHENPWLDQIQLTEPEEITAATLDGAAVLQGWVIPPANCAPDQKYPAILYVHGGPTGFYCTALQLEFQALAAAGFAVIYGNPRGSTGYGRSFGQDHYAYDNTAMNDLHQLALAACQRYEMIDPDRLGICGGSYGGYMTTWTAAHSHRFKAACAHRPLLNFQMIMASSHSAGHAHTRGDFESYLDYIRDAIRTSATTYVEQIHIPFQILQSALDANCIPEQAHQLYAAIRELHPEIPCALKLYPDSGHSLLTKGPVYLAVRHMNDNLHWFQTYL